MDERLEKQLAFSLEIDKVKNILRQTHLSEHGRRENDAEHSWHMAVMAYLLREYANEPVDIGRVMLMCLIHDIVEIDAGDTYAYDSDSQVTQKEREDRANVMSKILIVVDMQNDFIDGALGTKEAVAIVPYVKDVIGSFDGKAYFTRDTHFENYMETQEGANLPVPHCIKGTDGWQIRAELDALRRTEAIDKLTFGSSALVDVLKAEKDIESITFVGLCTDICVISNAMVVKAFFPEVPLIVDAKGCVGVSPESHKRALEAMKVCQIKIIND